MTLAEQVVKNVIKRLIKGQDYRIEIVALINAEFLQFAVDFFKKIVEAKLANTDLTVDWYKEAFLHHKLSAEEIAVNSGLNKKTITNMYNSATKEVVIDAANQHYDILYQSISSLLESQSDIDLMLTVKFRGISVDLNINESLIVINTLAVKRAALRGGLWSTAGKQVEKYLMMTLCKLFEVPPSYFDQTKVPTSMREVDFYLINGEQYYRCEVKLMGKGNPESADAVIARNSALFVADKLSDMNKRQLDELKVEWVELRSTDGFLRFSNVLEKFNIPHRKAVNNVEDALETALNELF